MKPNPFIRMVALLLVPCLVMDPSATQQTIARPAVWRAVLAAEETLLINAYRTGGRGEMSLFSEEFLEEFFPGNIEVPGHFREDGRQRSDTHRGVIWDGDVVLTTLGRRQADMTPRLPRHLITELGEGLDQARSGEIAGQPHAAMVSSLTKCNRMIFGAWVDSKWH